MTKQSTSRRQFLHGTGGFSLALPFLPSLVARSALGQCPVATERRFVTMGTGHGGVSVANMNPAGGALDTVALYPGHDIRHGALTSTLSGQNRRVSNVLSAPASKFTAQLAGKMNFIFGLDIPFYIAHNAGSHLGNFANNTHEMGLEQRVTIDQLMAWSPAFYPNLTGVRERSMFVGWGDTGPVDFIVSGYVNTQARTGVQTVSMQQNVQTMFDRLFVPSSPAPQPPAPMRPLIVDRVMENFRRLRQSNRRLSAGDKIRLDAHVAQLNELERRLRVMPAVTGASCGEYQRPPSRAVFPRPVPVAIEYYRLFNDVIAMGFACGSTRIATIKVGDTLIDYIGNWHQDIAHQSGSPGAQQYLLDSHRATFEHVFLDLAAKLDAIDDGGGRTVLDNTLMQWTRESSANTHFNTEIPVVTFGSAAGYFRTGRYVDYRNQRVAYTQNPSPTTRPGLLYHQYLATVLQAMCIPPAEFERGGVTGYGVRSTMNFLPGTALAANVSARASDPLPLITSACTPGADKTPFVRFVRGLT